VLAVEGEARETLERSGGGIAIAPVTRTTRGRGMPAGWRRDLRGTMGAAAAVSSSGSSPALLAARYIDLLEHAQHVPAHAGESQPNPSHSCF